MKIVNIDGYELHMTCSMSPEQYDVYKDGIQVGYLRMRWGCFRADYPTCGGRTVYSTEEPEGHGSFLDHERDKFLNEAIAAIRAAHEQMVS